MSAALDLWLTRLYRGVGGLLFLGLCAAVAYTAGDRHWPYEVLSERLADPVVPPGGALRLTRVVTYRAACEIRHERRLQSAGPDGRRVDLPPAVTSVPPFDLDGRPQTVEVRVPEDFPCGPALLVDSPSAACTWLQRSLFRQRRADTATPFRVACGP